MNKLLIPVGLFLGFCCGMMVNELDRGGRSSNSQESIELYDGSTRTFAEEFSERLKDGVLVNVAAEFEYNLEVGTTRCIGFSTIDDALEAEKEIKSAMRIAVGHALAPLNVSRFDTYSNYELSELIEFHFSTTLELVKSSSPYLDCTEIHDLRIFDSSRAHIRGYD